MSFTKDAQKFNSNTKLTRVHPQETELGYSINKINDFLRLRLFSNNNIIILIKKILSLEWWSLGSLELFKKKFIAWGIWFFELPTAP